MKTDDLIALLAKDALPVARRTIPLRTILVSALGAVIAFAVLVPWLGLRPDLAQAVLGPVFWMKAVFTFGLCIAGYLMVERLSRPGGQDRAGLVLAAACILLIATISGVEIASSAPEGMRALLLGSTWNLCFWRILVLSLPALAGQLWVMRSFAPTRPALAGAAAGLLAGGLAATVYGLHCDEFAAPVVALWYSLGIALSTLLGAIAGSRLLRW
jgi:hypothetical protein